MSKETELMEFLHRNVFDPILRSDQASDSLKRGVRYTIMRLEQRDARGMIQYYWSAIVGTERSTEFARLMKDEGFTRFEEVIDEVRDRFNDDWLNESIACPSTQVGCALSLSVDWSVTAA